MNKKIAWLRLSALIVLWNITACKFRQKADYIIHHATIYTATEKMDTAQALAVRDGKIIAIGSNDDILKEYESDNTKDAAGKFVYPGFIMHMPIFTIMV